MQILFRSTAKKFYFFFRGPGFVATHLMVGHLRSAKDSLLLLLVLICLPAATDTVTTYHDRSHSHAVLCCLYPLVSACLILVCSQAFGLSSLGNLFGSSKSVRSESPEVTLEEIRRLRCVTGCRLVPVSVLAPRLPSVHPSWPLCAADMEWRLFMTCIQNAEPSERRCRLVTR